MKLATDLHVALRLIIINTSKVWSHGAIPPLSNEVQVQLHCFQYEWWQYWDRDLINFSEVLG